MFLRVACLVFVAIPALFAATPEVDSSQLPGVPATPPEQALATFKIKPGFRLDLVAAEPLVIDPIAMSFDEDGRLYVVEMRDYSERRPERLGRIRLLEDTDGDGRFDQSTVFAGNLPWPTAVTCWAGGIFEHPLRVIILYHHFFVNDKKFFQFFGGIKLYAGITDRKSVV